MSKEKTKENHRQLSPGGMKQAEFTHTSWRVTPEYGTTKEDIEREDYFAHHALKLRRHDIIQCIPEDGKFYAEYLVVACDKTWAKLKALNYTELTVEIDTSVISDDYMIKLRGPKKWSVLRKSDNSILVEGLHHEKDAADWLEAHLKKAA